VRRARLAAGAPVIATLATLAALAVLSFAAPARAQTIDLESLEGEPPPEHYHSPRHFVFQLQFGPYRPDVDSEFQTRHPYQDYFGSGSKLLAQAELDVEVFKKFGTLSVGVGAGYFQVSGPSPVAGTGTFSADTSTLKVVPLSVSAVYRFDYLLETRNFPLVPYARAGLDYAYWQITDGNDEIANDNMGGTGRGGTAGWHVAAGLALVLDMFDPEAARDFDADLGVNHTAVTVEVSHVDLSGLGVPNRLHLGDTTWAIGLLLEF
jgi:hypothetical protein